MKWLVVGGPLALSKYIRKPRQPSDTEKKVRNLQKVLKKKKNLQLTVRATLASFLSLASMALFQATQRYSAPSSSFCGRTMSVDRVATLRLPPAFVIAPSNGFASPFRYHLMAIKTKRHKVDNVLVFKLFFTHPSQIGRFKRYFFTLERDRDCHRRWNTPIRWAVLRRRLG